MNYYKQVLTVTMWEYRRFFKLKNDLMGIGIMLILFMITYFGGRFAFKESKEKIPLTVTTAMDSELKEMLSAAFTLNQIPQSGQQAYIQQIASSKEGMLLLQTDDGFTLHSWKKFSKLKKIAETLDAYHQKKTMQQIALSPENLQKVLMRASLKEDFLYKSGQQGRRILSFFFAGLMILVVFLSFAYQFTAITGEKQLKITEQIISAITPQVWMDGKIFGITLTGLSSMLTYSIIGILAGMLYFQFTGASVNTVIQFLHLPSIIVFVCFTMIGILIWNAILAAIASVITDPNNSGKSGLMMMPLLFIIASFLVMNDPDNGVSVFLSWFPLTSATAMPMRWVATDVHWLQLAGSFIVLLITFYFLRRLAARIFRVSILISGKEPSWAEVIKLAKED